LQGIYTEDETGKTLCKVTGIIDRYENRESMNISIIQ
jgi:hypothetical protein